MSPAQTRETLLRYGIDFSFILYVGSSDPRKNLTRLLAAFAILLKWRQRWKLVVAGAARWAETPIADTVRRLGLLEDVRFTPFVPDEDLPALYNGADLFVFPSLLEGFGLPVLEAMACGTPVVTSQSSSLAEVATNAALLISPLDPDAIARAMRQVLDDPALASDLRCRGLRVAQRFSWERTARETLVMYEQVLGRSLGGR